MTIEIYQIYYNLDSYQSLDPGYIPFDNSNPADPELFEFSVMYHYFKDCNFNEDKYYGFLSPSFYGKTLVTSSDLCSVLSKNFGSYDAFYFTGGWDQIAYHQNVFTQGEFFHPGFLKATYDFVEYLGLKRSKLDEHYSTFNNSVFCNYVIANGKYWKHWFELADKLYRLYKSGTFSSMSAPAAYIKPGLSQIVFLQERLHSILLMCQDDLRILAHDTWDRCPILQSMFVDNELNRKLLKSCEAMKSLYVTTGDQHATVLYKDIRNKVFRL